MSQIFLISASFGSIYIVEIQESNSVNHVNLAGKNRMYAALTLHEIDKFDDGITTKANLYKVFDDYSQNIFLLKNGGIFLGASIKPLSEQYLPDLLIIEERFFELQLIIHNLQGVSGSLTSKELLEIEQIEFELLDVTDSLTEKLTIDANKAIKQKETLGIVLPIINAVVYVATIYVIFQTLKRENKKIQKLEKLYTIGQMASRLAHDLRNPLTVIKSSVDMLELKSTEKNEFTKSMCDRMKGSVKEIFHIIDDVLEFARTKELNISESSLLNILNQSVSSFNFPNAVTIELPQNDVTIKCDAIKLQSVFVNLFVNAMYAMNNNGKITVKIDETSTWVKILVIDSGPGIPKDILPQVFEPLFTSKPSGTGLGLGICKNIIEQHNGKISVRNDPTTFTVEFPKT
ncbi:sensor histidine kinase [Nitrosopumilus adriaticus]|uniref:Histidine kinase n=1 Tax=Nitrosopumilus adriaticus TaxID=1580092 RepID=A0A0D5C434_9ARCH|nr:HAMP domain-containing sensor histidine kinase [Nitrosopumilus adriaticus]AJW71293.1 Histidine kinase [Nitrosopumilus adriaticus]